MLRYTYFLLESITRAQGSFCSKFEIKQKTMPLLA